MAAPATGGFTGSHASPCRRRRRPARRRGGGAGLRRARRRRRRRRAAGRRGDRPLRRGLGARRRRRGGAADRSPGRRAARAGDEPRRARRRRGQHARARPARRRRRERRARARAVGGAALRPLRLRRPDHGGRGRCRLARALARHRRPSRTEARHAARHPRSAGRSGARSSTATGARSSPSARSSTSRCRSTRCATRRRPRPRSPRRSTSTAMRSPRRIRKAGAGRFIPVITLRRAEFDDVEAQLADVPGVALNRTTAQLAPSRGFGRALLGTVGPATAEQVEQSERAARGRRRRGAVRARAGARRAARRRAGAQHRPALPRDRHRGARARAPRRPSRQARCARCSTPTCRPPRSGRSTATPRPRSWRCSRRPATCSRSPTGPPTAATTARCSASYPPGSTFKIVSTAALLRAGLRPVGDRRLPGDAGGRGQAVPQLRGQRAPARSRSARTSRRAATPRSCRSPAGSGATTSPDVARDFGLGERLAPGVAAPAADVPPPRDAVGKAAMMIGQDRILASPLAMAGVAATVADGRWRAPRVLASAREPAPDGRSTTARWRRCASSCARS